MKQVQIHHGTLELFVATWAQWRADTGLAPQGWEEEAACLKWSFWAMTELDIKLWELVITGP